MKNNNNLVKASLILGLLAPIHSLQADSGSHSNLTEEWQEWALSIPTSQNPVLDTTGANCMIGQHGQVWFLAGVFGGGTATRNCSIPEGKLLFFPVINSVNINTPDVCGQNSTSMTIKELREGIAPFIDGASNLSVEIDGKPIKKIQRVKSKAFEIVLPEDNVFDAFCGSAGVPAGVYSPAVDDGYYVGLDPLKPGKHTLHLHAENVGAEFVEDVTYNLTVVPVSKHR